jgi:AcrR family transcriptional regulator
MNRGKKKQEKRAAILKAAHTEFASRRFDEVKLDDIAARAGVGKGTLYLYFKNKEDLFLQLAVDGIDEMAARMDEVCEMDGPFEDRFFLIGHEMADFFSHSHSLVNLMHQTLSDQVMEQFLQYRKKMGLATRRFLKRGVEMGVLRKDIALNELDVAFAGPLIMRSNMQKDGIRISADILLRIFWDGAKVQ